MNIDLLFTQEGEAGLISNDQIPNKVAGVLFDPENGMLTLELIDMDYMDMNIPVDPEFNALLDLNTRIHIGTLKGGKIDQAYQIPLLFNDDPYKSEIVAPSEQTGNPLMAFEYFMKRCVTGQPIFREDLGDEDNMGCILGDASPTSLQFSPHLARALAHEIRMNLGPSLNAPGLALGSSGSAAGGGSYTGRQQGDPKGSKDKS